MTAAIAKDAKTEELKTELVYLGTFDAQGHRAKPQDAAKILPVLKILRDNDKERFSIDYATALLHTGSWAEAHAEARGLAADSGSQGLLAAATAMLKGPKEAVAQVRTKLSAASEQSEALWLAGAELLRLQAYAQAKALYKEAISGSANSKGINDLLRSLKNAGAAKTKTETPSDVAKNFLAFSMQPTREGVTARGVAPSLKNPKGMERALNLGRAAARNLIAGIGDDLPEAVIADLVVASPASTTGDDTRGYQVLLRSGEKSVQVIVEKQEGTYGVAAINGDLAMIAMAAAYHHRKGNGPATRRWLDRAAARLPVTSDPFTTDAFMHAWAPGFGESAELLEAGVATLCSRFEEQPYLEMLKRCVQGAASKRLRLGCEMAMANVHWAALRYADAAATAKHWHSSFPESDEAFGWYLSPLLRAKQFVQAQEALKTAHRSPTDPRTIRWRASVAMQQQNLNQAIKELETLVAKGQATSHDYNNLAWHYWLKDRKHPKALATARLAVELGERDAPAPLNTLAAILATNGNPDEAMVIIQNGSNKSQEPRLEDMLVVALATEAYGLPGDAKVLFQSLLKNAAADEGLALAARLRFDELEHPPRPGAQR